MRKCLCNKKSLDRHRILRLVLLTGIILTYACISPVPVFASDVSSSALQEGLTVTGTVTDAEGQTLPGVNVLEKGTTNGAITNLDGQYTTWGQVVDGMEYVDAIAQGEPPADPNHIVRMQVAADADG